MKRRTYVMCPPAPDALSYDVATAVRQWEALRGGLVTAGHTVHTLTPQPGLPDLVFAGDGAFTVDGVAYGARRAHPQGVREAAVHEAFYRRLGGYRYVASSHVNRGEDFAYLPEAYGGMILAWYGFGTEAVAHVEAQDVRRRRAASLTRHSVDRVAGLAYSRGLTTASRSIRMRKFLVPVAAALVAVLAGCAHPTPPDGYGTTAPKPAPPATTAANTTADQAQVCSDAKSLSSSQVDLIKGKAAQAQAALGSGDQATLAQAINDLRSAASSWAAQLTQLSGKQITPQLKSVLTDGASTITALANSAAPPPNAQSQLDDFTNKLNAACS